MVLNRPILASCILLAATIAVACGPTRGLRPASQEDLSAERGTALGDEYAGNVDEDAVAAKSSGSKKISDVEGDWEGEDGESGSSKSEKSTAKPKSTTAAKSCEAAGNVTKADIDGYVAKHSAANPKFKYVHVPLDLIGNENAASLARVGLFKALNHTAIAAKKVYVGEDVSDGKRIVYAIDPEQLWPGYGESAWKTIAAARGPNTGIPGAQPQKEKPFAADKVQPMDVVAYNALVPSVYLTLIKAPAFEAGVSANLKAGPPIAFSAIKDAIVFGPRIIFVRKAADGRNYWVTCDEFIGREGKALNVSAQKTPNVAGVKCNGSGSLSIATIQAHEAWHDMENGFPAYYVFGAASQTRGKAERLFVVDPGNPVRTATSQGMHGGELLTGRSCITCHVAGVQQMPSDLAGQGNWTSNEKLRKLYDESRERYQGAMRKIVEKVSCSSDDSWNEAVVTGGGKAEPANALIKRLEK
jgi:hypothetical protein